MATLTPVAVTLPKDKVPTKKSVRDIIDTFFTKEWPYVDSETLTVSYHASFANAHCPVKRLKHATGTPTETLKVFIKFHNDAGDCLEIFKSLAPTRHEKALFCHE
jgi:choline kinase